jgi:hypothetical protein
VIGEVRFGLRQYYLTLNICVHNEVDCCLASSEHTLAAFTSNIGAKLSLKKGLGFRRKNPRLSYIYTNYLIFLNC